MSAPYLSQSVNGRWHYRRTVPESLRSILGKREIKLALGSDFATAMGRYADVHAKAERALADAKLAAPSDSVREQVLQVMQRHQITPERLAEVPYCDEETGNTLAPDIDEIIDSLIELHEEAERSGKQARISVDAIRALSAGQVPAETHTIASALEFYRKGRSGTKEFRNVALSNRIRKLKSRMAIALSDYAVSKRSIEQFTRADARRVRDFLLSDGLKPTSVRRTINIVKCAINALILEHDLQVRNPFEKLEIVGSGTSRDDRHPLSDEDMELVGPVMVVGDDPLSILWVVLRDTGARPREICTRQVADLDGIRESIRIPFGKTQNSRREVPLSPEAVAGLTKLALGKAPQDYLFQRYADGRKSDYASAALLKRLRSVLRDPKKVVYSLRHRMTDKLRDAECPEDIRKEIMGHDTQNVAMNYGRGHSLDRKRHYLSKVW